MDQPYSAWADWLDKFHTASELIQALWLIAVPVTVLGLAVLLGRLLREALVLACRRKPHGRLLYGVYENADGQVLVYRDEGLTRSGRDAPRISPSQSSLGCTPFIR